MFLCTDLVPKQLCIRFAGPFCFATPLTGRQNREAPQGV